VKAGIEVGLIQGASDGEENGERLWLQHLCRDGVQLRLPEPEGDAGDRLLVRRIVPVRR
jgi:hypothetical protein